MKTALTKEPVAATPRRRNHKPGHTFADTAAAIRAGAEVGNARFKYFCEHEELPPAK
ncbi:hypothetical protein [Pseudomonas sp. JZ134]|uniref:hypothetical protein n=1 Tax=Pseudomonas sp. JZ134 TaxID=2806615 RepID=UPI003DA00539